MRDVARQRELVFRAYVAILSLLLAVGFFSMIWSCVQMTVG
jgi:hypothetical protein